MKILVTGGHFTPAYAVIEKLKNNNEIIFVGRKYAFEGENSESLEFKTISELGIKFYDLKTGRFQRRFTKHTIPSLLKVPGGIIKAISLVKKINPDIVLTFGGYIGLPVSLAAYISGVPIVVHEQTQDAGLSNKIISRFAHKVCVSFESSRKYFPQNKVVFTGNPVRQEIFKPLKSIDIPENLRIIYITGGSTGSHFINDLVLGSLSRLLEKYVVIHQTGDSGVFRDFEKLEKARRSFSFELQKRYILKKFISLSEIGWIYKNASIVVARSGINTVCEILALSKLCLLIPLPHGQSEEQLKNANLVKKSVLGDYIEQNKINEDIFLRKINIMLQNENIYKVKSETKNNKFGNASLKIARVVKSVYEEKSEKEI